MELVDGQHDRQRAGEVRRDVDEVSTLGQRFFHHPILLDVQAENGFLQVANAAVDQFCTATACTGRKVELLDERDCQPCNNQPQRIVNSSPDLPSLTRINVAMSRNIISLRPIYA